MLEHAIKLYAAMSSSLDDDDGINSLPDNVLSNEFLTYQESECLTLSKLIKDT